MSKIFYGQRNNPKKNKFNLRQILELFILAYKELEEKGYFGEHFRYFGENVFYEGKFGSKKFTKIKVFKKIKKENLYPIYKYKNYTEEDLFDAIEFLHEHCTINPKKPDFKDKSFEYPPIDNFYAKCKKIFNIDEWDLHYEEMFDYYLKVVAQYEFRNEINEILVEYADGFVLNENGQIESLKLDGLEQIINEKLPKIEGKLGDIVEQKVQEAVKIFRRQGNINEKQGAIKQLADVLEHFKKDYDVKITSKDESDLFQLANQFAIRHFDLKQKSDYPPELYYSWIFQVFLATFHLWARLIVHKKVVKIVEQS